MPICEVLFEINDPVAARSALLNLLEQGRYKIKENTLQKIVAIHQLSLTKFGHKVEAEFDPATNQCILTTVTLRIDHSESLEYMKSLINKLAQIFPDLKVTSVKPKMSLGFNVAANVATLEKVHCEEIKQESSGWRCQYCGFENELGLDRCRKCGRLSHSLIVPEEEEVLPAPEDDNESVEE